MSGNKDPFSEDEMLLAFDAPAFVRRAMQVEAAWEALLAVCRRERDRLLEMPRMRLARFRALNQSRPPGTGQFCLASDLAYLEALHQEWQPRLRSAVKPPRFKADVGRALAELSRSFLRFNRRWLAFVKELDLNSVNQLREGYNRHYLLEKECALRSARLAREGFVPLASVRIEDLLERFPLLRVPEMICPT
jgi:hypothetical protein